MLRQQPYKIVSNVEVRPDIFLLRVEAPGLAEMCRPGQFAMVSCAEGSDRLLRRPISFHAVGQGTLDFLFSVMGDGTRWLSRKTDGEEVDILGPLGSGFDVSPASSRLLLVAGGLGIAPLAFLARSMASAGSQVRLLMGARTSAGLCPPEDLPGSVQTYDFTEDGSAGEKGLVTEFLSKYAPWADQIFVCGPLPMYRALALAPERYFAGKPVQASLELRMGCGLGFCYSCTLKTRQGLKQVCRDGPVFQFKDIVWESL
jgi:dihydroorotate dehydrogenase electron transfer subunit